MSNKKGLSSVVSVVLIIMLTASAISLIGLLLKDMISNSSFSPQVDCLEYKTQEVLKIVSVCYSQENREINLAIQRKSGYDLSGLSLGYVHDGKSRRWNCDPMTCGGCKLPEEGTIRNYFLGGIESYSSESEIRVYSENCQIDSEIIRPC